MKTWHQFNFFGWTVPLNEHCLSNPVYFILYFHAGLLLKVNFLHWIQTCNHCEVHSVFLMLFYYVMWFIHAFQKAAFPTFLSPPSYCLFSLRCTRLHGDCCHEGLKEIIGNHTAISNVWMKGMKFKVHIKGGIREWTKSNKQPQNYAVFFSSLWSHLKAFTPFNGCT